MPAEGKLTIAQKVEICASHDSLRVLASRYNVGVGTIQRAIAERLTVADLPKGMPIVRPDRFYRVAW